VVDLASRFLHAVNFKHRNTLLSIFNWRFRMPSTYIWWLPYLKNKFLSFLLLWMLWLVSMAPSAAGAVSTNDNRRPADSRETR
jgi:hypothetical protein